MNLDAFESFMNAIKPVSVASVLKPFFCETSLQSAAGSLIALAELWGLTWNSKEDFSLFTLATRAAMSQSTQVKEAVTKIYGTVPEKLVCQSGYTIKPDSYADTIMKELEKRGAPRSTLEKLAPMALNIVAAIVAIGAVVTFSNCSLVKFINRFGSTCKNISFAKAGITELVSIFGTGLQSYFGIEPEDPDTAKRAEFQAKLDSLFKHATEIQRLLAVDASKILARRDILRKFDAELASVDRFMASLATTKINTAAFKPQVDRIASFRKKISDLAERTQSATAGKVHPTVLWLHGASGVGKSRSAARFIDQLSRIENRPLTVYSRNPIDEFWSGYIGQDVVLYDDFNSSINAHDHSDLCAIYSSNAWRVKMADVADKGTPFCSKYVIICSNFHSIEKSTTLSDPSILLRRRDLVAEVHNPIAPQWVDDMSHLEFTPMALVPVNGNPVPVTTPQGHPCRPIKANLYYRTAAEIMHELATDRQAQYDASLAAANISTDIKLETESATEDKPFSTTMKTAHPSLVLLLGPPGSGKSHMAKTIAGQETPMDLTQRDPLDHSKIYLADDVTFTAQRWEDFKNWLVWIYDSNQPARVIITANTEPWDRYMKQETQDISGAILRRLQVVTFSFKYLLKKLRLANRKDIEAKPNKYTQFVSMSHDGELASQLTIETLLDTRPPTIHQRIMEVPIVPMFEAEFIAQPPDDVDISSFFELQSMSDALAFAGRHKMLKGSMISFINQLRRFLPSLYNQIGGAAVDDFEQIAKLINEAAVTMPIPTMAYMLKPKPYAFISDENDRVWCVQLSTKGYHYEYVEEHDLIKCKLGDKLIYETTDSNVIALYKAYASIISPVVTAELQPTHSEAVEALQSSLTPTSGRMVKNILVLGKLLVTALGLYCVIAPQKEEDTMQAEGWASDCEDDSELDEDYTPPLARPNDFFKTTPVARVMRAKTAASASSDGGHSRDAYTSTAKRRTRKKATFLEGADWSSTGGVNRQQPRPRQPRGHTYDIDLSEVPALLESGPVPDLKPIPTESSRDPAALDVAVGIFTNQVQIYHGDVRCVGALMLGANIGVTVNHISTFDNLTIGINGDRKRIQFIKRIPKRDIAFFEVLHCSQLFKKITHLVAADKTELKEASRCPGMFIEREIHGRSAHQRMFSINLRGFSTHKLSGPDQQQFEVKDISYTGQLDTLGYSPIQTKFGSCGAVILQCNRRSMGKIIGIHCAGSTEIGVIASFTQEDIPSINCEALDVVVRDHDQVSLTAQCGFNDYNIKEMGILTAPSSFGPCTPYTPNKPTTTQLRPSPLSTPDLPNNVQPAIMSIHDKRNTAKVDVYRAGVMKWAVPIRDVDVPVLKECVQEVANYYANEMRTNFITIRRLTKQQAINRDTTLPSSQPITRNTSAGWPFKTWAGVKSKNDLLSMSYGGDSPIPIFSIKKDKQGDLLHGMIDHLITTAAGEQRPFVLFDISLKDELLPMRKIKDPKTRTFASCPLHYTIAHRMYFHSAQAAISQLHNTAPVKVGIDPLGIDWHQLYYWMAEISTFGFDIDFKAFDATIPYQFMQALPQFYNHLYAECGNDEQMAPTIREHLFAPLVQPYVTYGSQVIQLPGGQISGQPGTAIDNSIVNMLYLTYAWKKIVRKLSTQIRRKLNIYPTFSSMWRVVRFGVYGDDGIITVNPEILPYFNLTSFAEVMSSIGVTVTNAAKNAEQAVIRLHDMEFLKRRFIRMNNLVISQLNKDSLAKTLHWTRVSQCKNWGSFSETIPDFDPEVIEQSINALTLEAFSHGKAFYTKLVKNVECKLAMYNITLDNPIPSWDERKIMHFEGLAKSLPSRETKEVLQTQSYVVSNQVHLLHQTKMEQKSAAPPTASGGTGDGTTVASTDQAPLPISTIEAPSTTSAEAPAHVGNVNILDPYFYEQFIPTATLTWTTAQLPGTLLWHAPIHPSRAHNILAYLSRMYNVWIGGLDYQVKIAGTGFHAGAIAIVRLPPNIHPTSLKTPAQFGAYRYNILDPKVLQAVSTSIMDQRPLAYHYMDYDESNPNTIGGWVAMFVLQSLNTSATGTQQIDVQIFTKAAQDFGMLQIIPPAIDFSLPTIDTFQAYNALFYNLELQTCPLFAKGISQLGIAPADIVSSRQGLAGLAEGWDLIETTWRRLTNGKSPKMKIETADDGWDKAIITYDSETTNDMGCVWANVSQIRFATSYKSLFVIGDDNGGAGTYGTGHPGELTADGTRGVGGTITPTFAVGDYLLDFNPDLIHFYTVDSPSQVEIKILNPGESFIYFATESTAEDDDGALQTSYVATATTEEISSLILSQTLPDIPNDSALLFTLVDTELNVPISYLKLYKRGYFTTNSVADSTLLDPAKYRLEYVSVVQENSIIPAPANIHLLAKKKAPAMTGFASEKLKSDGIRFRSTRSRRTKHLGF
ncbi:hypothetical protein 1 [Beihai picorna-like virus 121]|uniref:hypothetical protein 1 n=1 Tax=Beihai picorna-like virus 121 TaxID=1922550 RepID=UPI00090AE69C|nr:hypothetical protein 1 [Beihai picorna-like virus 121]APG76778.1 hypothetical protein 1 [Beihai picorna-like virus 121]